MQDIKLLALDMDGTLFTTEKEITPENRVALQKAQDLGVKVVITTGRPLKAIEHVLEELGLATADNYSVTFNGCLVQQNDGQVLSSSGLTFSELEVIAEQMGSLSLPIDVISGDVVYSLPSHGNHSIYHTANPMLQFIELESLSDLPKDIPYNKVVVVFEATFLDQQIAKIPQKLYQQFELFKSRDIILEIMPKGIHKAVGLNLLVQHLGLTREEVMAMGDEENDLTMLEWAGLGIAMANGTNQVKEIADAVTTKTNDESGVAEAVHRYILKEKEASSS